jgi:autotransporter-associated beta strand protein
VTSGATLNIADGVALTSPSSINLAGTGVTRSGASVGALTGTGTASYSGNLVLSGVTGIGAALGDTLTLGGSRSGAGSLTKLGDGTVVLGGSASYAGGTTVDAGVLTAGNATALGTAGTVTVKSGGTLNIADGITLAAGTPISLYGTLRGTGTAGYAGPVTLEAASARIDTPLAGDTLTLSAAMDGSGSLTKSGAGTLTLAGPGSFAGTTRVTDGMLTLQGAGSLGGGAATVDSGATLHLDGVALTSPSSINLAGTGVNRSGASVGALMGTGTASYSGGVRLVSDAEITAAAGGTLTLNGAVTGATHVLTVDGPGVVALAGGANILGSVSQQAGSTLNLGVNQSIVTSGAQTYLGTLLGADATLRSTVGGLVSAAGSANRIAGTLTIDTAGTANLAGHFGSLNTHTGTLSLGATTIDSNALITASGNIGQTGALIVGGATTINVGDKAIALIHDGNDFGGAVSATGGTTALHDINALNVALTTGATILEAASLSASGTASSLDASTTTGMLNSSASTTGDATFHAGSALTFGASHFGGNALITASGNIGQTGALIVGGTTTINAGDKAIALIHDGNDFGGAVSATGGATALHDINALNVALTTGATILEAASLSASGTASSLDASTTTGMLNSSASTTGDATFHAGSALTFGASHIGGNALITASGNIGQTGALIVGGATTINAGDKAIALIHDGNDFGGAVSATGGTTALHDINALNVALATGATILGAASLSASGTASSLDASTTTGMLNSSVSTTGDATFHAGSALTFGASHIGGNALITASGNIGQTGALIVGGTTTINAGDKAIALIHDGNDFGGAVSATGGTTALHDINALNVALATGATILGAASLRASGTASSLDASTTTGMLNSSVSTTGDATFHAGSALTFGASHIGGSVDAHTAGPVSQSGALDVAGSVTLDAGSNRIDLSSGANMFRSPMAVTGGTTVIASDNGRLVVTLATGDTQLSANEINVSGSMALTTTTSSIRSAGPIPLGNLSITGNGSIEIVSDATMGSSYVSNASVQNASGVPNKLAIFGASIYQQAGTRISTSPNVMLVLNANGKASIDLSADASVTMSDTALSTTRLGDLLSVFSKATSTNRILMHEGTNQIQGGISAVTRADESQGTNQPKTIVAIASDTITVAPGSVDPMTSVRKPAIDADSVMLIARAINGGGGKIQTHVAATAFGDGRNIATGPTRAEDKDYAILPSIFVISEPNTTGYSFGSLDVPISVSFGAVASQAGNSLLQTIAVDPFSKDGSSGPVPVYLGTNLQPGNDPTGPIKRYLVFPIDIPKNAIRAVVVNGIKIEDSSAYDAIQTAVAEILNQVRKEQLESGFSNENVAAQLRKGVITETRVGQAAVDRFQGVASSHRCVGMMVGEMVVCAPAAGPAP